MVYQRHNGLYCHTFLQHIPLRNCWCTRYIVSWCVYLCATFGHCCCLKLWDSVVDKLIITWSCSQCLWYVHHVPLTVFVICSLDAAHRVCVVIGCWCSWGLWFVHLMLLKGFMVCSPDVTLKVRRLLICCCSQGLWHAYMPTVENENQ